MRASVFSFVNALLTPEPPVDADYNPTDTTLSATEPDFSFENRIAARYQTSRNFRVASALLFPELEWSKKVVGHGMGEGYLVGMFEFEVSSVQSTWVAGTCLRNFR